MEFYYINKLDGYEGMKGVCFFWSCKDCRDGGA